MWRNVWELLENKWVDSGDLRWVEWEWVGIVGKICGWIVEKMIIGQIWIIK